MNPLGEPAEGGRADEHQTQDTGMVKQIQCFEQLQQIPICRSLRFYIQYPRPVVDCAPNVTADRPAHWSAQSITGCGYCLNVIGVLLFLLG